MPRLLPLLLLMGKYLNLLHGKHQQRAYALTLELSKREKQRWILLRRHGQAAVYIIGKYRKFYYIVPVGKLAHVGNIKKKGLALKNWAFVPI